MQAQTITIELPSIEQVKFSIRVHPEHIPVRGNAIVSGDDAVDKQVEDGIIARLDNGDEWAWCTVEVVASWRGITGNDYLGACCYADEEDFKTGGYFEQMKETAFDELIATVKALAEEE